MSQQKPVVKDKDGSVRCGYCNRKDGYLKKTTLTFYCRSCGEESTLKR